MLALLISKVCTSEGVKSPAGVTSAAGAVGVADPAKTTDPGSLSIHISCLIGEALLLLFDSAAK